MPERPPLPPTTGDFQKLAGQKMAGPEMAGPELAGPEMAGQEMAGQETAGTISLRYRNILSEDAGLSCVCECVSFAFHSIIGDSPL